MPSALTTNAILAREKAPPKSQHLEYGWRSDKDPQQKHRHHAWGGKEPPRQAMTSVQGCHSPFYSLGVPAGWWKEELDTAKLMGTQVVHSVAD